MVPTEMFMLLNLMLYVPIDVSPQNFCFQKKSGKILDDKSKSFYC